MNLADIRKKAEESRRGATAIPVETLDESSQQPEMDIQDAVVPEETSFDSLLMPADDFEEESGSFSLPLEEDSPETGLLDSVSQPEVPSAGKAPPSDLETEIREEGFQRIPAVSPQSEKRVSGYNPMQTILSGRESAADTGDDSLLRAHLYASEEVEEYLCFRVAHEEYAISIMAIKEIVKPREVTEVPRMPPFISGVLSLRGVIIPVMDMRIRLSLPVTATTGRERIVVVRMDSGFCGVLVDEVIQVARIKKSDIEEPPAVLDGIDRDFVTGLGHYDRRMLILLNLGTILDIAVH